MAEQMYKTAGSQEGQTAAGPGSESGPAGGTETKDGKKGDDVIDADYKEV
jgi:hypothetical protein